MFAPYALALAAACVALAAWALVLVARGRPTGPAIFVGLAVLLAGFLGQLVVGIVAAARGTQADLVLFFGYLITAIIVIPLAGVWALGDASRWGAGVLAIMALTNAVLVERMWQIWQAAPAGGPVAALAGAARAAVPL